jgi:hypothetical protein
MDSSSRSTRPARCPDRRRPARSRVGLGGAAVELLGAAKLAQVKEDGAQVDVGRRVLPDRSPESPRREQWRAASRPPPRPARRPESGPARRAAASPRGGAAVPAPSQPKAGPISWPQAVKRSKVEQQLAADGVDDGADGGSEARPGAHQAGLQQRIGHAATAFMATIECRIEAAGTSLLAQGAQGPQLAQGPGKCRSAAGESVRLAPTPATGGN